MQCRNQKTIHVTRENKTGHCVQQGPGLLTRSRRLYPRVRRRFLGLDLGDNLSLELFDGFDQVPGETVKGRVAACFSWR